MTLVDSSASAGTAVLELHNPQAQPDELVAGLIEQRAEDVSATNRLRDRLHVPEKAVPVDTSTAQVERLHCRINERLQIGDRVWKLTEVTDETVTLTPGRDHEAHTLVNTVLDEEYSKEAIALAEGLNVVDEGL